ncbi:hypothetical protein H109_02706 [Trichophyton interdigitale MR816]|uniref:Uncharacterized protein n=1 Tax=Trichophyton interdigitale (strain MR816) TaxID=1215338 RepID=A0A059JC44_TRIIM|nr:hypothetical protein H101_05407 [Trichophyton interdigitale H6]KDB25461.1 hypothetical protein H109_02706 [Trichophyton interdigitale MR816]
MAIQRELCLSTRNLSDALTLPTVLGTLARQRHCCSIGFHCRCELAQLSNPEKQQASQILEEFGLDSTNIPEVGVGNCQDWLAGAVKELERHGILPDGEGNYWRDMINLTSDQMKKRCEDDGKHWIDGPGQIPFSGVPDARYSDHEERNVGKLPHGSVIEGKLESLFTSKSGPGSSASGDNDPQRLYVSSPFFSQAKHQR